MKSAVILFVRNEADDIAWWIAWHLSIGFTTVVVYDDYSVDGTWEIVTAAARSFDVRPRRAVQSEYFNHRQAKTYMAAIDEFREEFDWLLCLDGDEYLNIRNGESVSCFLSRYPDDVGAIALNWKCFGSNRHVEKPPSPNVFENYTEHSQPDFELNYCVKSFFRPKRTETRYINPHRFAVEGRYITPNGQEVVWQDVHVERTVAAPDWSVATVNHYIIRSAEHFVEKSRRRSDIRRMRCGIGLFTTYDLNENHEAMPTARIDAMAPFLHRIQLQTGRELLSRITGDNAMIPLPSSSASSEPVEVVELSLTTHFGLPLAADAVTGHLVHADTDRSDGTYVPVVPLALSSMPDYVFLTVPSRFLPLTVFGDRRISTVLAYRILRGENDQIALKNVLSSKIMGFMPPVGEEGAQCGSAECNRDAAKEWEYLDGATSRRAVTDPLLLSIAIAISRYADITENDVELDMPRLVDARLAGLTTLSAQDMQKVMVMNDILGLPWVRRDPELFL
ncbi:glycosyltransferase family 2 protein [Acetobacter sp.]|uniref:glycosyltransferase family 2 protein n=1 Tax=Acetobacter sp. TaxID=440 RepID=UPI0039ED4CF3